MAVAVLSSVLGVGFMGCGSSSDDDDSGETDSGVVVDAGSDAGSDAGTNTGSDAGTNTDSDAGDGDESEVTLHIAEEEAGANCANGGSRLDIVVDGSALEEETRYICSGSEQPAWTDGTSGAYATIRISEEQAGDNCANGGAKVELLVKGQVLADQTQYVCNETILPVECEEGSHDGGDGNCVDEGTCSPDYSLNSAGDCISDWVSLPAGSTIAALTKESIEIAAFQIARAPVSVAQFRACVQAGACSEKNFGKYNEASKSEKFFNYGRGEEYDNHPMNAVNQAGAAEYCAWVGGRLPTEDEWTYAATHDGKTELKTTYVWGDDEPIQCTMVNYTARIDGVLVGCNGREQTEDVSGTAEIGTYSPEGDSPLGLVDMGGNVMEWTKSIYQEGSTNIVMKSTSWDYVTLASLKVASRGMAIPQAQSNGVGVRCVK